MKNKLLHRGTAAVLLAALALSGCASAPPEQPVATLPGVEGDAFLANLAGHWDITRKIRGTIVRNRLDSHWVLQHRFLELHMVDVARPPKYEAIVLIGYDRRRDRYVAHWTDTYGAGYSGVGYGRRVGDSVDFAFRSDDGTFHNTFTWNPAERTWRSRMESEGKDGARAFFAEDLLRRAD